MMEKETKVVDEKIAKINDINRIRRNAQKIRDDYQKLIDKYGEEKLNHLHKVYSTLSWIFGLLALSSFVLFCIGIVNRWILLGITVALFFTYIMVLGSIPQVNDMKTLKKDKEKLEKLTEEGKLCCSKEDLVDIIKGVNTCPVCGAKLEIEKNCYLNYNGLQEEKRSRIDLVTGEISDAPSRYTEKTKRFPATYTICPYCKYEIYWSEVNYFKEKKKLVIPEEYEDSIQKTYHEMHTICYAFIPGDLYFFEDNKGYVYTPHVDGYKRIYDDSRFIKV